MSQPHELRLSAPSKINWTLEVLGKRSDGYHEVRTILQTISIADTVVLRQADELSLSVRGRAAGRAIRQRWRAEPESNLAYRAALLLKERSGYAGGAAIELAKYIPVAAGLGGGSSDAAAVLRGLRWLWGLSISDEDLASLAAELGSDVPFFLYGGAALASGRGEIVEPLPDMREQLVVVGQPQKSARHEKTARMYAALRPEHYSDGTRTERLAGRIRDGEAVRDQDVFNVFEALLPEVDPDTAAVVGGPSRAHLCGSGPAVFVLGGDREAYAALAETRLYPIAAGARTLTAVEATAIQEL
jgi:4-diphosphocytidyl-2-C-methyl-D-erythritol kinase